eukprot:TRINITY_DN66356_c0_g1_i1.p1 TRINITY_DN66356_c0_g1~~TRINITY_DN66356_c0_g1_i1.p1  ORF type:complete len:524 (-),score=81.11 TRINITY_DN66356_c0_g1_i1:490-2061(-)
MISAMSERALLSSEDQHPPLDEELAQPMASWYGRSLRASTLLHQAMKAIAASAAVLVVVCCALAGCPEGGFSRLRTIASELIVAPWPAARHSQSKFFVWLTDPHVDRYYGTPSQQCRHANVPEAAARAYGVAGCDPPLVLFESAAAAAAEVAAAKGGAEFVLFTGDFSRHRQSLLVDPWDNVSRTVLEVAEVLGSMFSTRERSERVVLGSLGNSDSPEDYELNITQHSRSNPWLQDVARQLVAADVLTEEPANAYSYGGFRQVDVGALMILLLDTVIYSAKRRPRSQEEDPFYQFAWLRGRLREAVAQRRPVWIVGHIPPGIETHGYGELWHPFYLDRYLELVQDLELAACIQAQLFGHTHADEFRLLPNGAHDGGFVLIAGAISPVFESNPSFRLVEYDEQTGRVLNYQVYWAELPEVGETPTWKLGYDAVSAYSALRQHGLSTRGYRLLAEELERSSSAARKTYATWYKTKFVNEAVKPLWYNRHDEPCPSEYLCALEVTSKEQHTRCVAKRRSEAQNVNI